MHDSDGRIRLIRGLTTMLTDHGSKKRVRHPGMFERWPPSSKRVKNIA